MIPESHWYKPTEECPHPELWSSPDGDATEFEATEFIASLVRLIKPEKVLETGCWRGHTSLAIAKALSHNSRGLLFTCDTDEERVIDLVDRGRGLPLAIWHCSGVELAMRTTNVNLAFLDSGGPSDRLREMECLHMAPGGIILVHDARAFVPIAPPPTMFFQTPRGLALYQR